MSMRPVLAGSLVFLLAFAPTLPALALRAPQPEHESQLAGLEQAFKAPTESTGLEEKPEGVGLHTRRDFLGAMAFGSGFGQYLLEEKTRRHGRQLFEDIFVILTTPQGRGRVTDASKEDLSPVKISLIDTNGTLCHGAEFSSIPKDYHLHSRFDVSFPGFQARRIYDPKFQVEFQIRGEGVQSVQVVVEDPTSNAYDPAERTFGRLIIHPSGDWKTYSMAFSNPNARTATVSSQEPPSALFISEQEYYLSSSSVVLTIEAKGSSTEGGFFAIKDVRTETSYSAPSTIKTSLALVGGPALLIAATVAAIEVQTRWDAPSAREKRRIRHIARLVRRMNSTPLTLTESGEDGNEGYVKLLHVLEAAAAGDLGAATVGRVEALRALSDEKLSALGTKRILQEIYVRLTKEKPYLRHEAFEQKLGIGPISPDTSTGLEEGRVTGMVKEMLSSFTRIEVPAAVQTQRVLIVTPDGLPNLSVAGLVTGEPPLLIEALATDAAQTERVKAGVEELGLRNVQVHDVHAEFNGNVEAAIAALQVTHRQAGRDTLVVTARSGFEEVARFLGATLPEADLRALEALIERSHAIWM